MPFDNNQYETIYCHAVLHLFNKEQRRNILVNCYNQLANNGHMIFTVISKEAVTYGQGKEISKDRFEQFEVVKIFFYDECAINNEFRQYGLKEIKRVQENCPFYLIHCYKNSNNL